VINPREDFDINALGTLNLLEAIRTSRQRPLVVYASTNKVYGRMENVDVIEEKGAYTFKNMSEGVSESFPVDFHSPYGCSKGTADQYVRDYYRIYGIPSVVFRQSCVYGYRQFGLEDQGWIAWFMIASQMGRKITIYGDGKQVRDILFIDDLLRLYDMAIKNPGNVAGKIYNIGGGPANKLSVLELINWLKSEMNQKIDFSFSDWRPGDQPVYFSNIGKIAKDLDWRPAISREYGMKRLYLWIKENIDEIRRTLD
jgi:CDP-paratose 2-epimerase